MSLFSRLGHIFKVESRLRGCIDLEVFTEMNFGEDEEKLLRSKIPKVKIFRGGPKDIVHHIQRMSAADIFFPSSSAFSIPFCKFLFAGNFVFEAFWRLIYYGHML